MVERALRGVVREALTLVVETGLPGDHHFYLTFATNHPAVDIAPSLREQYPEEMTIVLQHQYFGLEVNEQGFAVTLSFKNRHERLSVPFAAVTTFADPSVNFALQFQPVRNTDQPAPIESAEPSPGAGPGDEAGAESVAKVVTLDNFRKK